MTHCTRSCTSILNILVVVIVFLLMCVPDSTAQQLVISRIEQMPNMPTPYEMRDWKRVARGYDSLVFDFTRTGTYLPLGRIVTNTVNYPNHNSFGLHTYVGTNSPNAREAINCLPAVVGATLAGIDKSNQDGRNYALMAEEWFNRRPSQNVYKNGPVDDSGNDFWYETMPNIFFYQLNALYPGTGDYNTQFTTVASRWLQALEAMGGSTTPWHKPNVDHRGWFLQTMTPYDIGVHEPEAAGALAWLLYHAHLRTDSATYRVGAEWAMEFLDEYGSNPSYELQLAYGAYLAARMNAELGTTYNVERMVNWCFDVGPLRSWGTIVGNWGGRDVSGLIGEVNGTNDYAFAMNTFEQVGALVPLVRYDDRFARSIGKWVLNAANAARLFYPNYLPDSLQDSEQWAHQYDPNSYIAYEALRQSQNNVSPFATGDALRGGWAQTNLGLYGSSHVGILAGIIDTTNVPMILRLDLLKTDYYHATAYPTFLYFNPFAQQKSVALNVGAGNHDLYDAVSNTFLNTNVSGTTTFSVPANSAIIVVVTPSGATITHALGRMLVNNIIADYRSGQAVANHPPRIKSVAANPSTILLGATTQLFCTSTDRDGDVLAIEWQAEHGTIAGSGSNVVWIAPASQGVYPIRCIVDDGRGGRDTAATYVHVVVSINHAPDISRIVARPRKININATSELRCIALDPDGDTLSYSWSGTAGIFSGSGSTVRWSAPFVEGNFVLYCLVSDGRGGLTKDSLRVEVRDFSQIQTGDLVAFYPFNSNANDATGHGNNGTVHNATTTADRHGAPNSAYEFDGSSSFIDVPGSTSLGFQQSTTINFWMKIAAFFEREQYPISHGNWENRWKVSVSNRRLRWTIKTTSGIKDVDSERDLAANEWYNVTVLYSGSDVEVYLNGELDGFTSWAGTILPTTIPLTIGQVLPNNQNYNFAGVLDDIRIYNYALSVDSIAVLAGGVTEVDEAAEVSIPRAAILEQNYPNPFNPITNITYYIPSDAGQARSILKVYDLLGREMSTLVDDVKQPGKHTVQWDASGMPSGVYMCRLQTVSGAVSRKMIVVK